MTSHESPNVPFTIFRTRFERGKTNVCCLRNVQFSFVLCYVIFPFTYNINMQLSALVQEIVLC